LLVINNFFINLIYYCDLYFFIAIVSDEEIPWIQGGEKTMIIVKKLLCALWVASWYCALSACPCCVGSLNEESKPFFCDECYQNSSTQQSVPVPDNHKEEHHE
jgi:hypothetical protein